MVFIGKLIIKTVVTCRLQEESCYEPGSLLAAMNSSESEIISFITSLPRANEVWGKVMFSQVFVHRVEGGLPTGGVCLYGGGGFASREG